jgi:alpha-amylase
VLSQNYLRLFLAAFFTLEVVAFAQISETNGVVRIEAEVSTNRIARTISGVSYSWTNDTATPGFSGSGYLEAYPADNLSTNTVTSTWETTSPQVNYSVTFSNSGTYYVWVRGFAGDATSAGVYVGLNGTSLANSRIDIQQYNAWAWANTAAGSTNLVTVNIPSAGTYTLNLWMRDAWLDIDRILLTRNPNFSPVASTEFWRNQNIYQIITDRFFDGDSSNNNFYGGAEPATGNKTHGGDWKGLERKLDYIQALGATAIWISPVLKNANGDFDYHGYAATDFYNVDPRFGSLQDLQRLVREAQKRGILVICDVVVNHGSTWVDSGDAGWPNFSLSGYNLRYNSGGRQYAAPFDPSSVNAFFGNSNLANIFHNNGTTQNWGNSTQVELGELLSLDDFRTESTYVRQKMKEIWSYWINTVGFDAYRLDTVKHVEMGFWDDWSPAMRAAGQAADKPNFFQFGEIFDGSDAKVGSYTGTKTSGIYKMESVLDYPLYYQVGSVFATASGATAAIENRYNNLNTTSYDPTSLDSLILNLDNHDNPRFLATTGSTTARLEMALVFMYTTRGIPSLYYGTEQDFNGGADPANREDMFDGLYEQGPSLGDNFNMTHPRFQLVAKLNNFRRLYPSLRTGTHHMLWANFSAPGLLAYARRIGTTNEVYVVMNTATSAQPIGARPTIHPAGTVLVNLFNPSETVTVIADTDGIPSMSIPATSYKAFVSQAQYRALQPVVTTISPSHDSTGVSVASTLSVTFSQAMNTNSVQSAFATTPATTGTYSWASGNTVMTYTPSSNMAGNTLYAVRIEATAIDSNNLAMQGAFESRFTTGTGSSIARPSINSESSSSVAETTATLNTTVTPNGAATTVSFQYGTTESLGSTTAGQGIGSGSSPVAVSANLTGLQANTTYYFRAVATNSQVTTTGNTLAFTTATALPTVATKPATFVGAYGANLNGDVTPNGLATSVYFEWGDRSDLLSNSSSPQAIGNGTTVVGNFARAEGLNPDSVYFYRVVASNTINGTPTKTYGATMNFRTLAVKPIVTTLGVTNATTTAATLQGTVNPNGNLTSFYFEYGATPSYGSATPAQDASNGTNILSLSAAVTGLTSGQVYYYRAVASNSFGVAYGSDQSFFTGLPPPATTTLAPTSLSTSGAQLRGSVNPNNSHASSWFEWGTSTNYGSTSRILASDNAESITTFNIGGGGTASSGTGFGTYSRYSTGTGAGTFLANNSSNQTIDGAKSFGAYAGSGTGISFRRSISTTRQFGTMTVSARFNVNNTKGFTGFNLKSANGSGASGFSSGELVSFGIAPSGGNNGILVTDASGQRVLDLGADVRNTIIDFQVDFDAQSRRYVVGAKFRNDATFKKISGTMSGTGTNVTHIGFAAWNSTGGFQDLMFDSLEVKGSSPLGTGSNSVTVSNALSGLSANTLYNYRAAAMNLDGGTSYGVNTAFFTGTDLSIASSVTGSPWIRGTNGEILLTVNNTGSVATSGTLTVTVSLPAGLTATGISGTGWTVSSSGLSCTRSDSLGVGLSYPVITLNVAVASNAAETLQPTFTISWAGDAYGSNNTITNTITTISPLDGWRSQYFGSSSNSGAAADTSSYAGDGVANLIKYALGLNPTVPVSGGLPEAKIMNNRLALTFNRMKSTTDIVYEVQASGDLFGWGNSTVIWSSASTPYTGGSNDSESVTVQDTVSTGAANQRFMRLQISRP